jgi:hypothetical protein
MIRRLGILIAVLGCSVANAEVSYTKNLASNVLFPIIDATTGNPKTGLSDITCSITGYSNSGEPTSYATTTDTTEVEVSSKGVYTVTLTAGETNYDRIGIICHSATASTMDYIAFFDTRLQSLVTPRGLAQSATGTTIVLASTEPATDDIYTNNTSVTIASGTGVGQTRCITDYVGSSKTATVATWTTNPDGTSYYDLIATPGCASSGGFGINRSRWYHGSIVCHSGNHRGCNRSKRDNVKRVRAIGSGCGLE